jgi:transcriptional regulator with XRE-family HTH domain
VPESFFDVPELRAALATYDFGPVFRAVRAHAGLSQEELGFLVGLSQSRVSMVEGGRHRLRDVAVIARVAVALGVSGSLLGFPFLAAGTVGGREEVSWMDRRDFFSIVAAIIFGADIHPELERLEVLLLPSGDDESPTRRRVGAADVEAIEQITAALRAADLRHGGGLVRPAAMAHLKHVLSLQDAVCSEPVRSQLLLATADLAQTSGWMSYDVERHDAARRLWMIALDTARRADHARSADLSVNVLLQMAAQARHVNRPAEALRLAQLGSAAATGAATPVSAGALGSLASSLSHIRAMLGEVELSHRAMGEAREFYANVDPATEPPWAMARVPPAEAEAMEGYALFSLASTNPAYAPAAVERLRAAVDGFGPTHARSRALNLPGLASCYFLGGDVAAAVATGHKAVTAISALSSQRAHTRLRVLAETAAPFADQSDVAELRQRIRETVTAVA